MYRTSNGFFAMGNLVDSIEAEDPVTDSDSEPGTVDIIIDLDAPEYHEYLKEKRKSLSEGALLNDITYLEWRKNNNRTCTGSQSNLVLNEINRWESKAEPQKFLFL